MPNFSVSLNPSRHAVFGNRENRQCGDVKVFTKESQTTHAVHPYLQTSAWRDQQPAPPKPLFLTDREPAVSMLQHRLSVAEATPGKGRKHGTGETRMAVLQ